MIKEKLKYNDLLEAVEKNTKILDSDTKGYCDDDGIGSYFVPESCYTYTQTEININHSEIQKIFEETTNDNFSKININEAIVRCLSDDTTKYYDGYKHIKEYAEFFEDEIIPDDQWKREQVEEGYKIVGYYDFVYFNGKLIILSLFYYEEK